MALRRAEHARPHPADGPATQARCKNDGRKRQVKHTLRHKRGHGQGPKGRVLQRARAHAVRGLQHDGRDRGFDAIKQPSHPADLTKTRINPGQPDQNQQRRQDEQGAGHHPAPAAVHQPADVGGQLLGLGAGQHHAVIQGMQKAALRDPAVAFHQLLVHE